MLRPSLARADQKQRQREEARNDWRAQRAYSFCRSIKQACTRQAGALLLLALLLSPQTSLALEMDRFSKIEDNNLAHLLNNVKEVARFTGYAFHSPFIIRVMGAGGEFGAPWEECNSLFQETYVISANSFDESPEVVAYILPLACDWQFSRWLEFPPRSEGGEAPITLEFIKRSPGKKEKLVWLKINPYQAELLEKSKKGTETYPPNIGYSRLEWLWKDKIAEVVEELSSLRQEASTPHLFEADVNKVRLVKDGTRQDGGNAKEVISISVVENNNGHDATSFYVDCPNNGDWAFGEWTLTGKESIEAGYLGFSLVERNSKRVRHILCNPWTAFVKDEISIQ